MLDLMKDDRKLKFVLKEVSGAGRGVSIQASAGCGGRAHAGPDRRQEISRIPSEAAQRGAARADLARALAARQGGRFSTSRGIEKDMASDEVKATIEEKLQARRGARPSTATPSYVVGNDVLVGAVGLKHAQGKGQRHALRQNRPAEPIPASTDRPPRPPHVV